MNSKIVQNADYISKEEKGSYSPLQVMCSAAGYYVGTYYNAPDGFQEPGSRDSGYFRTHEQAEACLRKMEAEEANGGEEEIDVSTPSKLLEFMSKSVDHEDWEDRCMRIKREYGGGYPEHWGQVVIVGRLYQLLALEWDEV